MTPAQVINRDYVAEQTRTVSRYYVSLLLHKPVELLTEEEIAAERTRIFAYRERMASRPDRNFTARQRQKYATEVVSPGYARVLLKLSKKECPTELVALKQSHVKLKRKLKEKKK